MWNPIRVAEEVALLDNLTQGRLECGFGAGVGPFTFAAYGVPWDEKRKMAWEALHMIKGIWANSTYSYAGEYFKCKNVELGIPLVQKPHPPSLDADPEPGIPRGSRLLGRKHDPVGAAEDEGD